MGYGFKVVLGGILAAIVTGTITLGTGTMVLQSYATLDLSGFSGIDGAKKAPVAISGDNVYMYGLPTKAK